MRPLPPDALIPLLVERIPGFRDRWNILSRNWGTEDPGICNAMGELCYYVVDLISSNAETAELALVFDLVEDCLFHGSSAVKDAIATCFLESLLNLASAGKVDARRFVGFLGPRSREHCRAWDEFTGVKTPELWP